MRRLTLVLALFLICLSTGSQASPKRNILFIHGAWSTGEVWNTFKNYFSTQEYNVYNPTFRYHSIVRNDSLVGTSMNDYLDDMRKIIKSMDTPPVIIAHSMGCIIAQRLAEEGLAASVILIAPPVNYGMMASLKSMKWINKVDHLNTSLTKPTYEHAEKTLLNNLLELKQRQVYASMTHESGQVMKELIWIKNLSGEKPNRIEYSKIKVPVLIVSGGKDRSSPVEIASKLKRKYKEKAEIKVFENNAHWMIEEENSKEIAEFILGWMER